MVNKEIFKDAYFGQPFQTRNGKKALFVEYAPNNEVRFLIDDEITGKCVEYYQLSEDRTIAYRWFYRDCDGPEKSEYDIVDVWKD